jgi:hypothetical protein
MPNQSSASREITQRNMPRRTPFGVSRSVLAKVSGYDALGRQNRSIAFYADQSPACLLVWSILVEYSPTLVGSERFALGLYGRLF